MQGPKPAFFIYMVFVRICVSQNPRPPPSAQEDVQFETKYMNEVADTLPVSVSEFKDHVLRIKGMMLPIVAASPKTLNGTLSHSSAKYTLYRMFMERHGWVLENIGMSFETIDTAMGLEQTAKLFHFGGKFPKALTHLLVEHVRNHGISTLELSLFVATLEKLIDGETIFGLQRVFAVKNVTVGAQLYKWQAEPILLLYVACYINGFDAVHADTRTVLHQLEVVESTYFNWKGTRKWILGFLDGHGPSDDSMFTFEDIAKIATNIVDNFVYWNNQQCGRYKERLLQLDDNSTGRVRLLDFYRYGEGMFFESTVYLRDLGALDEVQPLNPRVITSNYLDGPNNCVARTKFYSVCCMDECADLFSHLESSVGKPSPTVDELLPVLKNLNSASMMQCREWPQALSRELNRIAEQNGGLIVLHGRMFAEFMHMAYPNECASPQHFGPAHGVTMEDWLWKTRHEIALSPDAVRKRIEELEALEGKKEVHASKKPFDDLVVKGLKENKVVKEDQAIEKDKPPQNDKPLEKEETVDRTRHEIAVVSESHTVSTFTYKFCIASAMVLAWKLHQRRADLKEFIVRCEEQHLQWKLTELV